MQKFNFHIKIWIIILKHQVTLFDKVHCLIVTCLVKFYRVVGHLWITMNIINSSSPEGNKNFAAVVCFSMNVITYNYHFWEIPTGLWILTIKKIYCLLVSTLIINTIVFTMNGINYSLIISYVHCTVHSRNNNSCNYNASRLIVLIPTSF